MTISTSDKVRMKQAIAEVNRRQNSALALYEPLPVQEEFHRSRASERVIFGGNRGGKSLAAFMEDARAVLGMDPHNKYPKKNGILAIVGYDYGHIGRVIYPGLFRAGAYKIIRDKETGAWRSYRPWDKNDKARENEAKPAPPLIPSSYIKKGAFAWENKAARQFSFVELTTGWQIFCFPSKTDCPAGFQADLVHIDEDLDREEWVPELLARLSDRKGRLIWSSLPYNSNDALIQMKDRADKELDEKAKVEKEIAIAIDKGEEPPAPYRPDIETFTLDFLANPFIDADEKRKRVKALEAYGEDVILARIKGEFAYGQRLMYPTFGDRHLMSYQDLPGQQVPRDWCRYMIVDPGHTACAVIFAAVPPPGAKRPARWEYVDGKRIEIEEEEYGDIVLIYDELLIPQCNAGMFARKAAAKGAGQHFHAFIIDDHGSRVTDAGSGWKIRRHYSEALAANRFESEVTGHNFLKGSDDVPGRTTAVREWLADYVQAPVLRLLKETTPNIQSEQRRYRKKMRGNIVLDEPDVKNVHLWVCIEYLAAYRPKYHEPPKTPRNNRLMKYLEAKKHRNGPPEQAVYL